VFTCLQQAWWFSTLLAGRQITVHLSRLSGATRCSRLVREDLIPVHYVNDDVNQDAQSFL
jgi:hypothetical protein